MALVGAAIMAAAIWAPTVYVTHRKRRAGERVTNLHLALALGLELIAFVVVALTAQLVGFGGGEYLLAISLVVGAAGAHVLSAITFAPRSTQPTPPDELS
jgi:Kef-type K+ transport system membrane component KefB